MTVRTIRYVSGAYLPSKEASAVHIVQMCDAFVAQGIDVTLYGKHGERGCVSCYYGLQNLFRICRQDPVTHQLWLLRHHLQRREQDRSTVWFGRRHAALARLGTAGYPVALELHQPPHNRNQIDAVRQLVRAERFLGLVVISRALEAEMRARLPQLGRDQILVAHDGVRADRFREPTARLRTPIRAVYCGSFHRGKGVDTLLRAATLVPEISIDLMGGTREQIDGLLQDSPPNVRFIGHLPYEEAQRRLPDYDIALAPYGAMVRGARGSRRENNLAPWMSPLKLFEYAAAGLPVITTDLPVLREILSPNAEALMNRPGDVDALAADMRALASNAQLRLRLARAAQLRLRAHTWEKRAAAVADFLAERLGARPSTARARAPVHSPSI